VLTTLELNPQKPLLAEWLCEGGYGIIIAPRGVGKTWFAQIIAKAISCGGRVGAWLAHEPANVAYIDGEMPPDMMQERDRGLGEGEVQLLNHSILFDRTGQVLNVSAPEQQRAILEWCIRKGIKVLILDNLSTLASGKRFVRVGAVASVARQFRRHGIAVILVHHSGRNGEPRGTSKREDAAYWIIALDDAKKQADDKRGARFIAGLRSRAATPRKKFRPSSGTSRPTRTTAKSASLANRRNQ
jgi:RecA-family ATPase